MKKSISITMAVLVLLLSSCASNIHTTSNGHTFKKAGKNHHYQSKNGIVTRKKGKPTCVDSW